MKLPDSSWATAVVAVVSLVGMLLNRCDQKATDRALEKQFSPAYFQELKK
jgi:hypothetical protein